MLVVCVVYVPRSTHACQGGDDNHADIPHEQHDGGQYVDVHVSKRILDAQVHEAVRHAFHVVFARETVWCEKML